MHTCFYAGVQTHPGGRAAGIVGKPLKKHTTGTPAVILKESVLISVEFRRKSACRERRGFCRLRCFFLADISQPTDGDFHDHISFCSVGIMLIGVGTCFIRSQAQL